MHARQMHPFDCPCSDLSAGISGAVGKGFNKTEYKGPQVVFTHMSTAVAIKWYKDHGLTAFVDAYSPSLPPLNM